jgi:hypothetical protein
VGCEVRGVGCGVWSVGCGVWGVGLWSVECGVWGVGCGVVGCGVWGVICEGRWYQLPHFTPSTALIIDSQAPGALMLMHASVVHCAPPTYRGMEERCTFFTSYHRKGKVAYDTEHQVWQCTRNRFELRQPQHFNRCAEPPIPSRSNLTSPGSSTQRWKTKWWLECFRRGIVRTGSLGLTTKTTKSRTPAKKFALGKLRQHKICESG